MSTRATILIKSKEDDEQVYVYHHSDGFPNSIGVDMKEYLSALKPYEWDVYEIANGLIKGYCGDDRWYELTNCQHGDEEFAYLIDVDAQTIKCYSIGCDDFNWPKAEKEVEIPEY